jgi:hypothetical protein
MLATAVTELAHPKQFTFSTAIFHLYDSNWSSVLYSGRTGLPGNIYMRKGGQPCMQMVSFSNMF